MIKSVGVTLNNAFEKWLLSSAQQLRDLGKLNRVLRPSQHI